MNPAAVPLTAPVAEAILFEDRARIIRRGRATLAPGLNRLTVSGVAPVLADKSLSAALDGDAAQARIVAVRATRAARVLAADRPEELRELEAQHEDAERLLQQQRFKRDGLRRELDGLQRALTLAIADIQVQAGTGKGSVEEWQTHFDEIAARESAVRKDLVELSHRRHDAKEAKDALEARIETLCSPSSAIAASVDVFVEATLASEIGVRIEYTVPGACWRPWHTAQLSRAQDSVHFTTTACVWQNTGEDWSDVRLTFSTQRPSLGSEPPRLSTDMLIVQRRQQEVVVEQRDQAVQTTGLGAVRRAAHEMPGIDDGGAVQSIRAAAVANVPSDGRPHRIPLASFDAPAETTLLVQGELETAAIRRSILANLAPFPLLAGPVELIGEGGPVGRTSIRYVAPNERFALGWGPDPSIRVHREVASVEHERGMLSNWIARDHTVTLRLSHLGGEARIVTITERVPVSEIEKVQITVNTAETTESRQPDKDGFIHWTITLQPHTRREVKLAYALRRHKDVAGLD